MHFNKIWWEVPKKEHMTFWVAPDKVVYPVIIWDCWALAEVCAALVFLLLLLSAYLKWGEMSSGTAEPRSQLSQMGVRAGTRVYGSTAQSLLHRLRLQTMSPVHDGCAFIGHILAYFFVQREKGGMFCQSLESVLHTARFYP